MSLLQIATPLQIAAPLLPEFLPYRLGGIVRKLRVEKSDEENFALFFEKLCSNLIY